MGELARIVGIQLSLENMKSGVTTNKKSVKMELQARQVDIVREALWVIRNIPINFHYVHVYGHQYDSVH